MKTIKRIGSVLLLLAAMLWMTACSDMTDGKTFYERAMEKIPLPKGCSEWKYLPNDYDSDGKIEVFAFGGEEDTPYEQWYYIQVYYIDSQGNIQKVDVGRNLGGSPYGEKKDFSDCYLTIGKYKYAAFNVGDVYGSCGYSMVLGVYNGRPIVDYVDGTIDEITSDGYIMVSGVGADYIYIVRNGQFEIISEIGI